MRKSFRYTNSYSIHKELVVGDKVGNKYPVTLWSLDAGDYCGRGDMTAQELNDYLEHFGIKERIEE